MKKFIGILSTTLILLLLTMQISAQKPITVIVGGEILKTDVNAEIISGRTMIPLRAVFESIGANVVYSGIDQTITATKEGKTIELKIGSNVMSINGKVHTIDVAPIIKNNRTLVPIRACAEAFGLDVSWDEKTRVVRVKKGVYVISQEICSDGSITDYYYDSNGNLIKEVSGTVVTEMEYDSYGNMTYMSRRLTDSAGSYWQRMFYDENGYMIRDTNSLGNTGEYTYDGNGNKTMYKYSDKNGNINWFEYEYDENGRLIYKLDAELNLSTEYQYNNYGDIVYEYDSDGSWKKVNYTYVNGKKKVERINYSSGAKYEIMYDENEKPKYKDTNYFGLTTYTYDEFGNLIYETNSKTKSSSTYKYIYIVR